MTNTTRKPKGTRQIALQIGADTLSLSIVEGAIENSNVHLDSVKWRDSGTMFGPGAAKQLRKALGRLASKWSLGRTPVTLCLRSDVCVTRVIVGPRKVVQAELSELETRCSRYLSLGPGAKLMTHVVRQVDSRNDHALAAVVNERLLHLLANANQSRVLNIAEVIPSAIGLCWLAAYKRCDTAHPAILVTVEEEGAEICISSHGHLYLNYRPAGSQQGAEVAQLLKHHLTRLRRYTRRLKLSDNPEFGEVHLAGDTNEVARLQHACTAAGHQLSARPLIDGEMFGTDHDPTISKLCGPIGACLPRSHDGFTPDLLPELNARTRKTWRDHSKQWLVPAVVCFVLFVLGEWFVWKQSSRLQELESAAQPIVLSQATQQARLRKLSQFRAELTQLKNIETQVATASLSEIVRQIAQCMPNRMELDGLDFSDNGKLSLEGKTSTEASVHEFIAWLRKVPSITEVNLSSTSPGHLSEVGLAFVVQCRIALHEVAVSAMEK